MASHEAAANKDKWSRKWRRATSGEVRHNSIHQRAPISRSAPLLGPWVPPPPLFSWTLDGSVCSPSPSGESPQTSTYQTFSFGKMRKCCEAKKKKKSKRELSLNTISEARKVICDRTCQELYGRFSQSYEKERRLALENEVQITEECNEAFPWTTLHEHESHTNERGHNKSTV